MEPLSDRTTSLGAAQGPRLAIDLDAIAANWRTFRTIAPAARVAPVVKADAYGLGAVPVTRRLLAEGADCFFVATLGEGLSLQRALGAQLRKASLYVLNGPMPGEAAAMAEAGLKPVLNSLEQWADWKRVSGGAPCALHIDTGMNRLGLGPGALDALCAAGDPFAGVAVDLIVSHLACGDEADAAMNGEQLQRFTAALDRLPQTPASLAASAGALLGSSYHFDLVRPGIGLYGGLEGSPFRVAARLLAPIVQVRRVDKGMTVGYGATYRLGGTRRLATVAAGYADGVMRSSSKGGRAAVEGVAVPLAGRVSMDLVTIDVTELPEAATQPGRLVEFFGDTIALNEAAASAGTIHYEILTRIGTRVARTYQGRAQ
ncbi:MAG: alanine racemase [Alphaproteobacteria bacterium]|nr:alanine racemase [Alphaproteobacteria bacterium]